MCVYGFFFSQSSQIIGVPTLLIDEKKKKQPRKKKMAKKTKTLNGKIWEEIEEGITKTTKRNLLEVYRMLFTIFVVQTLLIETNPHRCELVSVKHGIRINCTVTLNRVYKTTQ